jgi:uncharacterized cupin superfamily protein
MRAIFMAFPRRRLTEKSLRSQNRNAMPNTNVESIPWTEFSSPKGTFRGRFREISLALGAKKNAGPADGGHPFDVALEVLAPGETCCPYHAHAAQWEFFYILSGEGTVHRDGENFAVKAGDAIMHPPGEAHQIRNTGTSELRYLLIADNPPVDPCVYPDSGKAEVFLPGRQMLIRHTTAENLDYFDGEE